MLQSLEAEIPYYAVIFISLRSEADDGYDDMARRMAERAAGQPGFLGMHHARQENGITVSYWKTEEAMRAWKQDAEHLVAQTLGRERWYADYLVKVCRVEREYPKGGQTPRD